MRSLAARGIDVVAYDPAAAANAARALEDVGRLADSAEAAVRVADVVVLATAWEEFATLDPAVVARAGQRRVVIDCWRILDRPRFEQIASYIELGRGEITRERVAQG